MKGLPAVPWGVFLSALVVSACASSPPPVEPAASGSAQPDAQECPELNLTGPSGSALDLTGSWQGNDYGLYELHQDGSCLYWLGRSQDVDAEFGTSWTNVFYGTVRNDFTVDGHWGDVPNNPEAELWNGEVTLDIGFDTSGAEFPYLTATDRTGGFGATSFVPMDALGETTDLEGTFGGNYDHLFQTGCLWVQVGDVRYELIGDGGWSIRADQTRRIEDPESGRVVAREGDAIRVNGLVLPVFGEGCVESSILVYGLEPIPAAD